MNDSFESQPPRSPCNPPSISRQGFGTEFSWLSERNHGFDWDRDPNRTRWLLGFSGGIAEQRVSEQRVSEQQNPQRMRDTYDSKNGKAEACKSCLDGFLRFRPRELVTDGRAEIKKSGGEKRCFRH